VTDLTNQGGLSHDEDSNDSACSVIVQIKEALARFRIAEMASWDVRVFGNEKGKHHELSRKGIHRGIRAQGGDRGSRYR